MTTKIYLMKNYIKMKNFQNLIQNFYYNQAK